MIWAEGHRLEKSYGIERLTNLWWQQVEQDIPDVLSALVDVFLNQIQWKHKQDCCTGKMHIFSQNRSLNLNFSRFIKTTIKLSNC